MKEGKKTLNEKCENFVLPRDGISVSIATTLIHLLPLYILMLFLLHSVSLLSVKKSFFVSLEGKHTETDASLSWHKIKTHPQSKSFKRSSSLFSVDDETSFIVFVSLSLYFPHEGEKKDFNQEDNRRSRRNNKKKGILYFFLPSSSPSSTSLIPSLFISWDTKRFKGHSLVLVLFLKCSYSCCSRFLSFPLYSPLSSSPPSFIFRLQLSSPLHLRRFYLWSKGCSCNSYLDDDRYDLHERRKRWRWCRRRRK